MSSGQFGLLKKRRFAPFFGVQFLGALNDNVFKQALVILLTYSTASYTTMSTDILQNLAQALFVFNKGDTHEAFAIFAIANSGRHSHFGVGEQLL